MLLTESENQMITEAINMLSALDLLLETQDINDPEVQPKFHQLMREYGQLVENVEKSSITASEVLNERLNG